MAKSSSNLVQTIADDIIEARGHRVMIDARVAEAFGTETKRVNEAVARNPEKFSSHHCFKLTNKEWENLRSQNATPNKGRGGSRYAPHVFTMKGVARLATVLETDAALRATDMIIDTFLMVYEQASDGNQEISIVKPSDFVATPDDLKATSSFKKKLLKALTGLLDTVVDPQHDRTLQEVGKTIGSSALQNVTERLREKGLQNTKLEADTKMVLAETEKLLAEARKTKAEAIRIDMDIVEKKIAIIRKLIQMSKELEPYEFIKTLESFEIPDQQPRLIKPKAPKRIRKRRSNP